MKETIAAISTGLVPAGIGIVRISGEDAFAVADSLFVSPSGKRISDQKGNTVHYGHIVYESETLDEVLATVLRAPHSYTGEDTVEIGCHGGILAVKKVLDAVLHSGARPAEPGEFTKRAFLNGRIDLSQAEAVMDVISSGSEYALKNSLSRLQGKLGEKINDIRSSLLFELAFIESALDDPEHYSLDGYKEKLLSVVKKEQLKIRDLLNTFEEGKLMDEGIRTVILGKPNVGKSSLLNCLTGTEKAIVTDIPGTTRDLLEETIVMKGFSLRIIDTAGIRDSSNPVEKIGIERAREQAEEANLILYIADATDVLDDEDKEILELTRGKKAIFLINKTDLLEKPFEKDSGDAREDTFEGSFKKAREDTFEESFKKACENTGSLAIRREEAEKLVSCPIIEISAKEGTGMDTLKDTIENMFFKGEISFNDEVYITSMRHKTLLEEADTALTNVCSSIDDGMPEDFFSIDLMGAVKALDGITGGDISEELADEIFSKFCMGK